MTKTARPGARKRATNVSLRADLLREAKKLDLSVSQAAEDGLERAIAAERQARWLAENRAAIDSTNAYVGKHGLPLARYRQF